MIFNLLQEILHFLEIVLNRAGVSSSLGPTARLGLVVVDELAKLTWRSGRRRWQIAQESQTRKPEPRGSTSEDIVDTRQNARCSHHHYSQKGSVDVRCSSSPWLSQGEWRLPPSSGQGRGIGKCRTQRFPGKFRPVACGDSIHERLRVCQQLHGVSSIRTLNRETVNLPKNFRYNQAPRSQITTHWPLT